MVSDRTVASTTDATPDAKSDDRPGRLLAGAPSIHDVLDVASAALRVEVVPATDDRPQYVVRMACRLIEIVQRELDDGPEHARELHDRLRTVGATDESDLARGLLAGRFDTTDASLRAVIHDLVRWRMAIARPDALRTTDSTIQTSTSQTSTSQTSTSQIDTSQIDNRGVTP